MWCSNRGNTRTIAEKAIYIVGQDKESVQFLGHALWQDGERQGSGERVNYDRRKRLLVAEENAYLRLPRRRLGEANLFSAGPRGKGRVETNTPCAFVEVFADKMTIQLSPTNGPVQSMVAEKNVLIVDPGQDGRALADRATYVETSGLLELERLSAARDTTPARECKDLSVRPGDSGFSSNAGRVCEVALPSVGEPGRPLGWAGET